MNYKVDLRLSQSDTTGNKPIIDVLWNGSTVISSYTISNVYSTDFSQFASTTDVISFNTDVWNSTNTVEILYKNKSPSDITNEIKVRLLNIISSSSTIDPGYRPDLPIDNTNSEYMYINPNNWIWTSAIVDGGEESANLNEYPDIKNVCWPIEIKNANASITINSTGTVLSSNTQPLTTFNPDLGASYNSYNLVISSVLVN